MKKLVDGIPKLSRIRAEDDDEMSEELKTVLTC